MAVRLRANSDRKKKDQGATAAIDMSYLEGTIGYMIRRAQMAVFADIYRTFDDIKITTVEFSVLAVVADNGGINQADLASALGVERPRMVPIINKLQDLGLASRTVDSEDGRARRIHLTPQGRQMLATLKRRFAEHQARILARLGISDPEKFLRELRKLTNSD